MAILITTVLLLFYASPFIPFIFQFLMIGFLLLFSLPSKEDSTQSSQFEIWVFFFVATILPFILYSTASSSAFFSSAAGAAASAAAGAAATANAEGSARNALNGSAFSKE